jgi:hypothetical protein
VTAAIVCGTTCLISAIVCSSGGNVSTNCCVVSACLYTNAICQCGSGNINSNCCILGQVVCGIGCVQGTCVCAAGGNLASNCCVVAPIHCATTCFVGNGSGLTNLPSTSRTTLISNTVASGASSIAFTNLSCNTYKYYYLEMDGITTNCSSTYLYALFSNNNGTSYNTTSCYLEGGAEFASGAGYTGNNGANFLTWMYNALYCGGAGGSAGQGNMCIYNAGSTSLNMVMNTQFSYFQGNASIFVDIWTGSMKCGQAIGANAFCIYPNVGTISGNFRFYGVN